MEAEFDFTPIKLKLKTTKYLLVCPIGWHVDRHGEFWTDRLWAKDLLLHFEYLTLITVLAPQLTLNQKKLPSDWVRIDPKPDGLAFMNFPSGNSLIDTIFKLPRQIIAATTAVMRSDVVHSGAAGWPIPPGIVVNPIALVFGKPLVIVIESAFWRNHTRSTSIKARLRHYVTEVFAKWSCRQARLAIFTHQGYLKELLSKPKHQYLVSPASWIDASMTLTMQDAIDIWNRKTVHPQFLVAARLVEAKGIPLVIETIELAEKEGFSFKFDFIGEGPLREGLLALSKQLHHVQIKVLDPVAYGAEFFELIQKYHAMLVPTISDEQPRIIFDSNSQAVPVIASNTVANQELIIDQVTGILFQKSSATSLLDVLRTVTSDSLRVMGSNSLTHSVQRTHQAMHYLRAKKLVAALETVD